jgi:hypothetical protein
LCCFYPSFIVLFFKRNASAWRHRGDKALVARVKVAMACAAFALQQLEAAKTLLFQAVQEPQHFPRALFVMCAFALRTSDGTLAAAAWSKSERVPFFFFFFFRRLILVIYDSRVSKASSLGCRTRRTGARPILSFVMHACVAKLAGPCAASAGKGRSHMPESSCFVG